MAILKSINVEISEAWYWALELWEACSVIPMRHTWFDIPNSLIEYLNIIYRLVGQPFYYDQFKPVLESTALQDTNTVVLGFTGGKDSIAAAIKLQNMKLNVILYYLDGINRAWPDEIQWVKQAASVLGMPLIIRKVAISGKSGGFLEIPVKNQIILSAMVSWAQSQKIPPATFSMGLLHWDTIDRMNPRLNLSDSPEVNNSFCKFLREIYPNFIFETVLEHESESVKIVYNYGYMDIAHGCMAQLRYREQLRRSYLKKVGIYPMLGRCGTSCDKCAHEIVYLYHQNILELKHLNAYPLALEYLKKNFKREYPTKEQNEFIKIQLGPLFIDKEALNAS